MSIFLINLVAQYVMTLNPELVLFCLSLFTFSGSVIYSYFRLEKKIIILSIKLENHLMKENKKCQMN